MKQRIFELLDGFQEDFDCEIEEIVDFVNEKEEEIQRLKSKIEDLEEENEVLEEENNALDTRFQIPDGVNDNIVLSGALEDLFSNLSKIPVNDLCNFVKKYSL